MRMRAAALGLLIATSTGCGDEKGADPTAATDPTATSYPTGTTDPPAETTDTTPCVEPLDAYDGPLPPDPDAAADCEAYGYGGGTTFDDDEGVITCDAGTIVGCPSAYTGLEYSFDASGALVGVRVCSDVTMACGATCELYGERVTCP